jgi:ribosome-binding protein aMBF1 (putative translation factor)
MGHYCRICGRTRANEKFSGKGHKNNVCKDCSSKSVKKAKRNSSSEDDFVFEIKVLTNDVLIQSENMFFDDDWFPKIDLDIQNIGAEDDEELPF